MSKSYKLKDGNYIDSKWIVHNKEKLSDVLNKTNNTINAKVNGKKLIWGNKFQFNLEVGHQALVLINYNHVILVWRNAAEYKYSYIHEGTDLNINTNGDTVIIEFNSKAEFTGAVFYF